MILVLLLVDSYDYSYSAQLNEQHSTKLTTVTIEMEEWDQHLQHIADLIIANRKHVRTCEDKHT